MSRSLPEKMIFGVLAFAVIYPVAKYALPIFIPFLLGLTLALAAEPATARIQRQWGLRRSVAAGIGVTGVLLLSVTVLILVLSPLVRQLGRLAQLLPAAAEAIRQGTQLLRQWLLSLAEKMPMGIRQTVTGILDSLFQDGSGLLQQAAGRLPQMASSALGRLSSGFIGMVTATLSAYMISARLPQLKQQLRTRIPEKWRTRFFPAVKGFRSALGHWLLAQGKLAAVTLALLLMGFWMLKIPNALLWALLVTLVDILPILGVGTVLLPWSLVCYLQGDGLKALGLLGIFLVAWLVRSVLEPKFIGKELGLDPLVTLLCIYAGFRLWGIAGMLLAPAAAICVLQLCRQPHDFRSGASS